MGFKIEQVSIFIAVGEDGDEGVIGIPMPGSNTMSFPAVAADETRAKELYPVVKRYCDRMGIDFKVIHLSTRTDVTHEYEKA